MGLDMYLFKRHKDASNEANEQMGYWRKANSIHNWFETTLGEDTNCNPVEVDISDLHRLRQSCKDILEVIQIINFEEDWFKEASNMIEHFFAMELFTPEIKEIVVDMAEDLILSPTSGFFFGGTEIDEYYFRNLLDTIFIIDKIDEWHSNEDIYIYESWW